LQPVKKEPKITDIAKPEQPKSKTDGSSPFMSSIAAKKSAPKPKMKSPPINPIKISAKPLDKGKTNRSSDTIKKQTKSKKNLEDDFIIEIDDDDLPKKKSLVGVVQREEDMIMIMMMMMKRRKNSHLKK